MAGWKDAQAFLAALGKEATRALTRAGSRHRKARMLRFVYRHPNAAGHRAIIKRLRKAERRRLQAAALRRQQVLPGVRVW